MKIAIPVFLIFLVAASGCLQEEPSTAPSISQAKTIAESFIRTSPTFRFDGIPETLAFDAVYSGGCTECLNLYYYFESSHAGYGDRSGQALTEVVTPHSIEILVNGNIVTSAIMDYKWDESQQKELEKEKQEDVSRKVRSGDTFDMAVGQSVYVEDEDMKLKLANIVHRECTLGNPCTNPELSAEMEAAFHGYVRKIKINLGSGYQFPGSVNLRVTNLKVNTATFSLS